MITFRSASFWRIFLVVAPIAGLLFGFGVGVVFSLLNMLFGIPLSVEKLILYLCGGVIYGLVMGISSGWMGRGTTVAVAIVGDTRRLREVIENSGRRLDYEIVQDVWAYPGDETALIAYKKRRHNGLTRWEAEIHLQLNQVLIEGPTLYAKDLVNIVETAKDMAQVFIKPAK